MNEFTNTNYVLGQKADPVGVYRIARSKRKVNGKSCTCNFYYARVHKNGSKQPTSLCKTDSREKAEAVFLKNEPNWQGPVPFYDRSQPSYKKRLKSI